MAKEVKESKVPEIDEVAVQAFKAIGFDPLPRTIVNIYHAFKRRKDILQPGRLTPEGYATIAVLADLSDGKIELTPKE